MRVLKFIGAIMLMAALFPASPAYASAGETITGYDTPLASSSVVRTDDGAGTASYDQVTGKRVVRVGWYNREAVDAGDETNLIAYERDYLYAVGQYANWEFEFVPCDWDESIQRLYNHQIDLLCTVTPTAERQPYMDFSEQSTGTEMCYLVAPENTTLSYGDYASYDGLRVGYEEGNRTYDDLSNYVAKNGATIIGTPYANGNETYAALAAGEVDAVAQSSFYDVPSGDVVLAKCAASAVYFATWKGNAGLMGELDEAMNELLGFMPNFNSDLYNYHYKDTAVQTTEFSPAERAYLDTSPTVTMYYEQNWAPIEYEQDGHAAGIAPEVLQAIGEDTGINFVFVLNGSSADVFGSADASSSDSVITLSYDYTWARQNNAMLTQPILTIPLMRVTRVQTSDAHTVGLVKGNFIQQLIRSEYPDLQVIEYATFGDCMEAVSRGAVDCTYINSYQATYYAAMGAYNSLSYQSDVNAQQGISIGVTGNSNPLAFSVISKSLQRLSSSKVQTIVDNNATQIKTTTLTDQIRRYPLEAAAIATVAMLLVGIVVLLLITSRSRKRRNDELLAANNAKSDFLARMSHDIRTPMNAILGYTTLARDQVDDPRAMGHYLERIGESGEYLLTLLNDILDMSKIESKQLTLSPEPFSTAECVENVRSIFASQLKQKNLTLTYHASTPQVELLMMDRVRYQQIFMNLISNAIKYTPEGGVISVETKELDRDAETALTRYAVTDTGCGMSPEFLKEVFEPFTQERSEDRGVGSGLGLAITKNLIELMGGTLHVESEVGKGTKFWFTLRLPLAKAALARQPVQQKVEVDLTGVRVLVVDDQPMNLEITCGLLEKKGAVVSTAENGQVALDMFCASAEGDYDIILMDVRMPVMNGLDAARAIRALNRADAQAIPIVALSANAYADDVSMSREAGMDAHVAKPFDVDNLFRTIDDLVAHAEKM